MIGVATGVDARCASCRHFDAAPRRLEAEIAGLVVMGSAYASVRAGDGLCAVHRRYVSAASRCARFDARIGSHA